MYRTDNTRGRQTSSRVAADRVQTRTSCSQRKPTVARPIEVPGEQAGALDATKADPVGRAKRKGAGTKPKKDSRNVIQHVGLIPFE